MKVEVLAFVSLDLGLELFQKIWILSVNYWNFQIEFVAIKHTCDLS
jgi:hypothetical protein